MKRLALTISAVVLGTMAASAADMAPRYTKAPVAAPIMTYSWTGCYIGGNVGGGWERVRQTQIAKVGGPAIVPNNDFGSSDGTDLVGGGQIGCDYQINKSSVKNSEVIDRSL